MKANNDFISKPGKTSLLPQYFHSEYMYERFLDATGNESEEIFRSRNQKGIKISEGKELEADRLEYFIENKEKLEKEFYKELCSVLSPKRANKFCKIVRDHWYDGRLERESKPVLKLMASVKNYLIEYRKVNNIDKIPVINEIPKKTKPSFDDDEINEILSINLRLVENHLEEWISIHPQTLEMGLGDLYCRRGIFLDKLLPNEKYLEWQYINSYSLSFSVTEKFSQMYPGKIPVILNTNYANIRERILFFSPFIKGMNPYQLELGIIPHYFSLHLRRQGRYGGIYEYDID